MSLRTVLKTSRHFCLQWSFYGPPNYEQCILMAISAPLGIAVFKHVSLSSWCMVQIEFGDQTCAKSWCILISKKEKPVHGAEMCFSPERPHETLTESVTQAVGNSWDIAFTFTSPIFQEHHRIPFWSENLVRALKPSFVFSICTDMSLSLTRNPTGHCLCLPLCSAQQWINSRRTLEKRTDALGHLISHETHS